MFKPNYKIGDIGFSGKSFWRFRFWKIVCVICGDIQVVTEKPKNPYRELQYGGTSFGFKGKNYWFSDDTLIGRIMKCLM